jgi:hypothetical protein
VLRVSCDNSAIVQYFILSSIGFDRDSRGLHADRFTAGVEAPASLGTGTKRRSAGVPALAGMSLPAAFFWTQKTRARMRRGDGG